MSNDKENSVEWLENEFASLFFDYLTGLIDNKEYNERHKAIMQQDKAMHKQEIKEALIDGSMNSTLIEYRIPHYYHETFGE